MSTYEELSTSTKMQKPEYMYEGSKWVFTTEFDYGMLSSLARSIFEAYLLPAYSDM